MSFSREVRSSLRPVLMAASIVGSIIGTGVAFDAVRRDILGPPTGISETSRVLHIRRFATGSRPRVAFNKAEFASFASAQTVFQSVAAWSVLRLGVTTRSSSEISFVEVVTGQFFEVMGRPIAIGRGLTDLDDQLGAPRVAVLSHGTWSRDFGARSTAVGDQVNIAGTPFEIIGVANPEFGGVYSGGLIPPRLWIPFSSIPDGAAVGRPGSRHLLAEGRLRAGVGLDLARSQLDSIGRRIEGPTRPWDASPFSTRFEGSAHRSLRAISFVLFGVMLAFVVLALSTLSGMFLARHLDRKFEYAIQMALGATGWRLVRRLILESVSVAVLGLAFGLLIARYCLAAVASDLPITASVSLKMSAYVDPKAVALAIALAGGAIILTGVWPAFRLGKRIDLSALLSQSGTDRARSKLREGLVVAQIAAAVLLVGTVTACLLRVARLEHSATGLDLSGLTVAETSFRSTGYSPELVAQVVTTMARDVVDREAASVTAVATGLPFGLGSSRRFLSRPGDASPVPAEVLGVSSPFLDVFRIPLLQGRGFPENEQNTTEIILSRATALSLFRDQDPLGQTVILSEESPLLSEQKTFRVRGIVADMDAGELGQRSHGVAFVGFPSQLESTAIVAVRTANPSAASDVIRASTTSLLPSASTRFISGTALVASSTVFMNIVAVIAGNLGAAAYVLAVVGLWVGMANYVRAKRHEIGVRVACGANQRAIMGMVLREGARPIVVGFFIGSLLMAIVYVRLQRALGERVPELEPVAIVIAAISLAALGLIACIPAARQAINVDPRILLRQL